MSVWDGVVVNPLERAYERPPDAQGEEDMETEEPEDTEWAETRVLTVGEEGGGGNSLHT